MASENPPEPESGVDVPPGGSADAVAARRTGKIAAIALAVVLVLGGTAAAAFFVLRGSGEELLVKTPADVDVFLTAYLDPGPGQKVNLRRMASEFPALGGGEQLDRRIDGALGEMAKALGLDFEADIRPWLGSQLALAVRVGDMSMIGDPSVAFMIDSKDDGAAAEALAKLREGPAAPGEWTEVTHEGVTINVAKSAFGMGPDMAYAIVDGAVVIATDSDIVKDVIDTSRGKAESLETSKAYSQTVEGLPESRLGILYVDGSLIRDLATAGLAASGDVSVENPLAQLDAFVGMGLTVTAEPQGLAVDFALKMDESKLSAEQRESLEVDAVARDLLAWVPEGTYGFAAGSGALLDRAAVDEVASLAEASGFPSPREALASLTGESVVEVGPGRGTVPVGGALMLGTDDAAAMSAFLDQAAEFAVTVSMASDVGFEGMSVEPVSPAAAAGAPEWRSEEYRGATIHFLPLPGEEELGIIPAYTVAEGMGILASSPEEIKRVLDAQAGEGGDVSSDATFGTALDSVDAEADALFYADMGAILDAVGEAIPPDERPFFEIQAANVRPLKAIIVSTRSGALTQMRMFLLIPEG